MATAIRRESFRRRCAWFIALGAVAGAAALPLAGCNRNKRTPRPKSVELTVDRDVPTPLRGTIGAVARLRGINATRVSGIGFVVGVDGTGGMPIPEQIAAHLEREMSLMGIGQPDKYRGTAIAGKSPRQLLSDRNTAAVIVEAAVPPGLYEGASFDIYVRALNATSLEGGTLWTTQLRPGPPSAFGNPQARVIGEARGPIFINPFAEPGAEGDGVIRTVGRVLDGGQMNEPLLIDVVLDNPSHARARLIASAINSAFPRGVGDREQTARGHDEQLVRVRVPYRYKDRSGHFAELVRHLAIDQTLPEAYARRFSQSLRNEPAMASDMSWCLEALGERSLPFLRDLYDFPEVLPRLAALRAGANLEDPRAAEHLIELAKSGTPSIRGQATRLLGRLDAGPRLDQALNELMGDDDLVVRVAAYEALAERAIDARRKRLLAQASAGGNASARLSVAALDTLSRTRLPDGTIQRVSRRLVDDKFFLDRAPAGEPLVYITQQGEPRIVLFGDDVEVQRPTLFSAWSDRLLIAADSTTDPLRVMYRDTRNGGVVRGEVDPSLPALVEFLAHSPTPEDQRPGLGLSYSEVVGVLYELNRQGAVAAAFTTERDRLLAELLRSGEKEEITVRPETADDEQELVLFGELDDPARVIAPGESPRPRRKSLLVPLHRPAQGEEGSEGATGSLSGAGGEETSPMRPE